MELSIQYLYGVKILVRLLAKSVKQNLYSVKIASYKAEMTRKTNESATRSGRVAAKPATARAAKKSSAKPASAKAPAAASPYHHGALRDALLEAAERVLERDGLAGLTLRAVAREAGVSHAAPTHHFGDLTGLLSELAAIGYRRFSAALATATSSNLAEQGLARAHAYLGFAQAQPGLYGLMFRTERLDMARPSLHEAANASFAGLAGAIGASRHEPISASALSLDQAAAMVRVWSLVHGFAMLLLDGRLADVLKRSPAGTDAEMLFDAMLKANVGRPVA
jgi:AcrR family transcriptional regulator